MFKMVLILISLFTIGCSKTSNEKKEVLERASEETSAVLPEKNERPVMSFALLDGRQVEAQSIAEPMVLILFQPDCDHCQNEAKQLQTKLDLFANYDLYFISSATNEEIRKFAEDHKLLNKPKVFFGSTSVQSVLDNFGAIPAPSLYIYSKGGKLVERFEGEVDIDVVANYL